MITQNRTYRLEYSCAMVTDTRQDARREICLGGIKKTAVLKKF
jgi:hypothetical protein